MCRQNQHPQLFPYFDWLHLCNHCSTKFRTFQVSFFARTTAFDTTGLAPTVYKVKYGVACCRQCYPCNVPVSQAVDFPSMSIKSRYIHHGVRGTSGNLPTSHAALKNPHLVVIIPLQISLL